MGSQKVENLLNLALDTTEEEREKSLELDVGYNPIDREWDVIVKYSGSLENAKAIAVQVTELLNEFAVITVLESRLDELAALPEIEYVEKPKRLFFQVYDGKRVSCINTVQDTPFSLSGKGTMTAVIDSGIDYMLPDFRKEDGSTRILAMWDQSAIPKTQEERPPEGYQMGVEYTEEQINQAIRADSLEERRNLVSEEDISGHGTAVAAIAAGGGGAEGSRYAGVAPETSLLIVKLASPKADGFPRTTELMMGIDYAVRKSLEYQLPAAINISFGYPSVAALTLWIRKYQKNPSNINLQFHHSIPLYL